MRFCEQKALVFLEFGGAQFCTPVKLISQMKLIMANQPKPWRNPPQKWPALLIKALWKPLKTHWCSLHKAGYDTNRYESGGGTLRG